jgi:hypothetical protein
VYCDRFSSDVELLSSSEVDAAFAARLEPTLDIVSVSPCDETAVASSLDLEEAELFTDVLAETLLLPKILFVEL